MNMRARHSALLAALAASVGGALGFYLATRLDTPSEVPALAQATHTEAPAPPADMERFNAYGQLAYWPGKRVLPRPGLGARTLVAVVFGQSNAGNHGGERSAAANDAVSNYFEAKFYAAADPLLGSSGVAGSPWVGVAQRLIAAQAAERVVLIPAAVGSTSVEDWKKGGRLYAMLETRLTAARADGLTVTHFLWHQGESDNRRNGRLTPAQYTQGMRELIAMTQALFPQSKFFVAQATLCGARLPMDEDLRRAQAGLAGVAGVYAGPDTDAINAPADRYDGCHFSGSGLRRHADAWVAAIQRIQTP